MHVSPHPLACVPLQPLGKPPLFPSFHPATNTVTTLLTHQKTAIHPTLPGKKCPVSSQLVEGPEHRVRLHPSAECRCSSYALPCISSRAHTYRQMDQAPAFVCRLQIHRLVSHVSLPSSLPRSPCPPRYKRHRASTPSQQRQPAAAASSSSGGRLCAIAAACEGLPWRSPGYLCYSVEHRDCIVPARPLSASNRF